MNSFVVKYLDDKTGESVMSWKGKAKDAGDALDQAMDDDYYFGKLISVDEDE